MKVRFALFATIFVFSLMMVSCFQDRLYEDIKRIPSEGWRADYKVSFSTNISDTSKAYDIILLIRNQTNYRSSNLWLFMKTSAPNGDNMVDTVEFILADDRGRWFGKGLGSVKTLLVPYKKNIRFPYRGIYKFEIMQGMRTENLEKIKNIGFRIQEHK